MSKYAALLGCITIDDSNKAIRRQEGASPATVNLALGDYFLRGDGGSGDFCAALKDALETGAANTYTVSITRSVDPTAASGVVTITRASGSDTFAILWANAATTFDPSLLGFEDEDTANDASAKVSTLSPAAMWISSDVVASSEPEYEYDVSVPETQAGGLHGSRRGGPHGVRRLSFGYLDTMRVHDEENLADPDATFTRFHERIGNGIRFETHFVAIDTGLTLDDLDTSTRLGTAWHFDEDTAAELAPRRLEPGLPLYALDLRLLAWTDEEQDVDTTTWAGRLAGRRGRDARLYFTIQGVPNVFQEADEDVPSTLEDSARPRTPLIRKRGIKISPPRLNMATRRMEGGTVNLTLVDDDDGTLAALFSPRRRRDAYLTGNIDDNDTTINVTRTAAFTDSVAYIDAETVTFPSSTSTSFTSAVRGAYDSPAQGHFGGSDRGSGVFSQPPSWMGRRVYLYSYFVNDDGTTTTDLSRTEATLEIEYAPRFVGADVWEIQCRELSDSFWKRKIGSGLREIDLPPEARMEINPSTNEMRIQVGEGEAVEAFTEGVYQTQAIVKLSNDEYVCRAITDVDPVTDFIITLSPEERVSPPASIDQTLATLGYRGQVKSARHVAIMEDVPASMALMVLTSRLGDYANGSFDQLPGMNATEEGGTTWRMGAGIEHTDVDTQAFINVGNRGGYWTYVIDAEITVGDFLFDFCLQTGSIAYVTRAGLLSVMALAESSNASEMTIDNTVILGEEKDAVVTYDEENVRPRVRLRCNYDPLTKEYVGEINMSDTALMARYPNTDDTLALASRAIVVSGKPIGKARAQAGIQGIPRITVGPASLQGMMRRIQVSEGRGRAYVDLRCHLDVMKLGLASLVELTVAIPDLEGARSFGIRLCRVLSIAPDWYEGFATLTLQVLDKLYVIAPGVRIASASGAAMTMLASGFESSTSPGLRFAEAGQPVEVWDVSAATSVSRTIVDITGNVITLSSAPGFTVQNNVDFIRPDNASLAITAESASGFDGFDYTYQIRSDENDPDVPFVSRWR